MEHAIARGPNERVNIRSSVPFFLLQLLPLLAFVTGVTTTALALLMVTFFARMLFITAGYHRYFAHRSYKLGRVAQFVMAFGGGTACQKGVLWWAGHHRRRAALSRRVLPVCRNVARVGRSDQGRTMSLVGAH
jgi:stearoyl-CoA desaturase (Delta-9 desaturase)